jgi:hypothetical protein
LYDKQNRENWDDVYRQDAVGSDRDGTGTK